MSDTTIYCRIRTTLALLAMAGVLAACGGGSDASDPAPRPSTGTVALLLTDMPTHDLDEINLDVVEATLIGGEGQQTLFSNADNPIQIDLLHLQNFSQPIGFEDVPVGVYTKLRLRISKLTLVKYVEDGENEFYMPPLPANGKIDLLHPEGFEVLPGRTLIVELDMDANKSFQVVQTGNSQSDKGQYRFRPVVFVEFSNTDAPDKLTRIEGRVDQVVDGEPDVFVVCSRNNPDTCIDVSLTTDGCVYGMDGTSTDPETIAEGDDVVVIGRYSRSGDDVVLDAIVIELGPAELVVGSVNSLPDENDTFVLIDRQNNEIVVELQKDGDQQRDCTQVIRPDGSIVGWEGLDIGQRVEVEGVRPPETDSDPMLLRAALIIIDGDDAEERVSGTIAPPFDKDALSFFLVTSADANGGVTVVLDPDATIKVLAGDGNQEDGTFDDDIMTGEGDAAEVFGELGTDGFFHAREVIIEVAE